MERLIEQVGGFGRYQKFILFMVGLCTGLIGFTTYASIFVLAKPDLKCSIKSNASNLIHEKSNLELDSCKIFSNITESKQNGQEEMYECNYDKQYYGISLVTELDLICEKNYLRNLTQTIWMFGCFCTFFIGYFSDKYGRKKVLLSVLISTTICFILCSISQSSLLDLSDSAKYNVYAASQFILGIVF